MVSHWNLSNSKSPQVSRTLLSILADHNKAVVWIVSTCAFISKSSSPFTKILGIVPSAPTTIGTTVTVMVHSFFSTSARSRYLSLFSLSFLFTLGSVGTGKSTIREVLLFFLTIIKVWSTLGDPFVSQNPREIYAVSFSKTDSSLCIYHLFV